MTEAALARTARIGWTLHGVRVNVESESGEALAYALAHLGASADSLPAPHLRISLSWAWGAAAKARGSLDGSGRGERIGKELFETDGELVWTRVPGFEGLTIRAAREPGGFHVSASCGYAPRDPLSHVRYLRASRRAKKTHRTFFKLMYYAVYYPLIWHFERTRGWGLLHASAVERNGRAIVLSGLGGAGKATLALSLMADPSFRFISDNLILHDEERIYSLPEPVRLDPSSVAAIGAAGFVPSTSDVPPTAHPKPTYRVEAGRVAQDAVADAVILLRSTKRAVIRPLGPEEALAHLVAARDLVREVDGYRSASALFSLAVAAGSDRTIAPARLSALLSRSRAYLLGIGEGEPVSVTLARIREVCA
ncbi:MAG: hypothetical protein HY049_08005 [Acidobacteria bacterium]|nr:hypothetical protein [Acidobacteriota bacterium]